jgi:hypothetical protein
MTEDELNFVVFCIEFFAEHQNINEDEAYDLLAEKSDCVDNYMIDCCGTLHTLSKEYLMEDFDEYLKVRGVSV